jgi:hypothetical protein
MKYLKIYYIKNLINKYIYKEKINIYFITYILNKIIFLLCINTFYNFPNLIHTKIFVSYRRQK